MYFIRRIVYSIYALQAILRNLHLQCSFVWNPLHNSNSSNNFYRLAQVGCNSTILLYCIVTWYNLIVHNLEEKVLRKKNLLLLVLIEFPVPFLAHIPGVCFIYFSPIAPGLFSSSYRLFIPVSCTIFSGLCRPAWGGQGETGQSQGFRSYIERITNRRADGSFPSWATIYKDPLVDPCGKQRRGALSRKGEKRRIRSQAKM